MVFTNTIKLEDLYTDVARDVTVFYYLSMKLMNES